MKKLKPPNRAQRLVGKLACRFYGHDYRQITWPERAYPMVECSRCHKTGWMATT